MLKSRAPDLEIFDLKIGQTARHLITTVHSESGWGHGTPHLTNRQIIPYQCVCRRKRKAFPADRGGKARTSETMKNTTKSLQRTETSV
jgi:hypothetical protein